jgi:ABC-type polysaccharide/polyol phosphate transport system ATPase subunit
LARLFSGIEKPDSGDILIEGRTSWPLGFAGFLHPNLTVLQNMHTIAGLVGIPQRDLADFCAWFCDMPGLLARMTRDLSPTERASIAYACALAIPCDHLVADDTIVVGDKRQRQKCEDLLDARLCDAGLVFLSKNASQLKQYCDRTFVLIGGRLSPCSDLDAAQDALEAFANNSREKEHADG